MSKKVNVLIIPSSKEEWEDLKGLLFTERLIDGYAFFVYDVQKLYKYPKFIEQSDLVLRSFESVNPFAKSFFRFNVFFKAFLTLINAIKTILIVKRFKINIIFSSTPLIFIRLSKSILKNKIKHISYLRSAYPTADKVWSDSDKAEKRLKDLRIPQYSWIKPYNSDLFLVSGVANKNMLISRNFPSEKINLIGPTKLLLLRKKSTANYGRLKNNEKFSIIFAMQAFKHHNDYIGHISQMLCLNSIIEDSINNKLIENFIVRLHPRDRPIYYKNIFNKFKDYISFSRNDSISFLKTVTDNRILVSSTSTLLFEWGYLGGKSYSIGTNEFINKYSFFYNETGILPFCYPDNITNAISGSVGYISKLSINKIFAFPGVYDSKIEELLSNLN
jgi:hypothetical protein